MVDDAAAAVAGGAGFGAGEAHRLRAAARDPLQRHNQPDLDAGAARRPGAAAEKRVEQPAAEVEAQVEAAEQVLKVDAAEQVFLAVARHARVATGVVLGPLLGVG